MQNATSPTEEKPKPNGRTIHVDFTGVHPPYTLEYLKQRFLCIEKPSNGNGYGVIEAGNVIPQAKLPSTARKLFQPGGMTHGGDFSSQDEAFVCSILAAGHSPQDTLATFANSPRGRHAAERHRNFDDYAQRTVVKGVAFVAKGHVEEGTENWRECFPTKAQLTSAGDITLPHFGHTVSSEASTFSRLTFFVRGMEIQVSLALDLNPSI